MIEIQCTSCHTRYRIDERVLPDDTPTFKCSRCGHVFNADPVPAKVRKPAAPPPEADSESQPARTIRAARPRPSALKSQVESDIVKREPVPEPQPAMPEPEVGVPRSNAQLRAPEDRMHAAPVKRPTEEPEVRPAKDRAADVDDPLNRTFGDREPPKADTGENLKFDFSDERNEIADAPPERELERDEPSDGGWEVGEVPAEFEARPIRQAPTMMDERGAAAPPDKDAGAPDGCPAPRRCAAIRSAAALRVLPRSRGSNSATSPTTVPKRRRPAQPTRRECFSRCSSSSR